MSLKRINGTATIGGYYVPKGYWNGSSFEGKLTVSLGNLTPERRSALVLSLKRGYSRGEIDSEQYSFYALVCEKFGMKHAKISSGRYNYIPLPDNEKLREFRSKVLDKIEPMFQLTDEKFSRRNVESDISWCLWRERTVRGQRMLSVEKPKAVSMNVFGKGLKQFLPTPDFEAVCLAVAFVDGGGDIIIECKGGPKYETKETAI